MTRLPTLVALFLFLSVSQTVLASPCVAFDANWNLFAFGLNGKDYNATTQDNWTGSNKATDVTISGRPPFDGTNTTCYLSQFQNAIYVVGADEANPTSVYIYNAATTAWSQQPTTPGGFNTSSFTAILDHDTNVFYAVSHGEMWFLDMQSLTAAQSSAIPWSNVGPTPYGANYNPVMALANNHVHFLDVPNVPAGSADIYVIHFSYFQPQPQAYPLSSGNIPAAHGQATSFFQPPPAVQQEFAFIPDDGSATYVVNVINNNTQQLAGPTTKDAAATYFASITALVQLTSNGVVSFLPYTQGNNAANSAASWFTISALAAVAPPTFSSHSTSGTATSSSAGSQSTSTSPAGSSRNGAGSMRNISRGLSAAFALAGLVCIL